MFTLKLLSDWHPGLFGFLAIFLAWIAWFLYRRELRGLNLGSAQWVIPLLRSLAILLIVLTLAEPAIESRHREGQPGHVHFLIDGSESMSITDSLESANTNERESRLQRAIASLVEPTSGIHDQIANQFDVSIWRTDSNGNLLLWKSTAESPDELSQESQRWIPSEWSPTTALGEHLSQLGQQILSSKKTNDEKQAQSIIVLMSDGQSNAGLAPQAATDALAKSSIPITTVGFGPERQHADLVLKAFEVPQRLFITDRLSGKITLADILPKGADFQAQLLLDDKVLWQQSLTAQSEQQREIPFDIPMEEIFQLATAKLSNNVQYNVLPIKLTARLVTSSTEISVENNQQDAFITVSASKAKILLVDGRSRWETRYLKNLFSRDPTWQITSVIGDDGDKTQLPESRADWQAYHLVILGDVPASLWGDSLQSSLVDFVNRGGGLVVCDGARQHLHGSQFTSMSALLPVQLQSRKSTADSGLAPQAPQRDWSSRLTTSGQRLPALNLANSEFDSELENAQLWTMLPKVASVQSVSLAIGSQTLVEAVYNDETQPLLVSRRFGAGQVLYLATDETWRWRYKVADSIHQRLWNQLARWVMRKPMSIESEYLSLDSGAASYQAGAPIELRASLRQPDGSPAENRRTVAIISRGGETISRVNLIADELNPGFYASSISDLPIGEYQISIEAEGFTKEALLAESNFAVTPLNSNVELMSTDCNSTALQQISQATGGQYVHESQLERLPDLLRPWSGGRIVHSTRQIWQSYYWFCAALVLLAIEWVLRKRVGLI